MKLTNLTPHPITIQLEDRAVVIEASGTIARVALHAWEVERIDGIPIARFQLGRVANLPPPEPGVLYIVSRVVADAAPERNDLLVTLGQIRDDEGRVVASHGLAYAHGGASDAPAIDLDAPELAIARRVLGPDVVASAPFRAWLAGGALDAVKRGAKRFAELPARLALVAPGDREPVADTLAALSAIRARWAASQASDRPVDRRVLVAGPAALVPHLGCALDDRGVHPAIIADGEADAVVRWPALGEVVEAATVVVLPPIEGDYATAVRRRDALRHVTRARIVDAEEFVRALGARSALSPRTGAPSQTLLHRIAGAIADALVAPPAAEPSRSAIGDLRVTVRVARVDRRATDEQRFLGAPRAELLEQLRTAEVVSVSPVKGGVGLALRLQLDGLLAFCKPAQRNAWSQPRREVAAYRIAAALGIATVPPCVLRRLSRDELVGRLAVDRAFFASRIDAEATFDADAVVAAWVPGLVDSGLDTLDAIRAWSSWLALDAAIPEDELGRMQQLSSLLVFDRIIDNGDRFSGGGVEMSADGETLFVVDNSFGLGADPAGNARCARHLARCYKFSRRLYEHARALDPELLGDVLTVDERAALAARTRAALAHIDALIARNGEARTLVFP